MEEERIDELFKQAGEAPVDPAVLARVTASMTASIAPVRPIANLTMLTGALFAVASLCGVASGGWLGLYGFDEMSGGAVALMFSLLACVIALAALHAVSELIPGSRRRIASWQLLGIVLLAFLVVDAILFRDYDRGDFVEDGVVCLKLGLEVAAPVGAGAWLVLRRGFAVDPPAAGLAAGTLAGLAGVVMLELHCPLLLAPHIMVWHAAVIPVAALAGMGIASLRSRYRAA